jgi:hypothetical protein
MAPGRCDILCILSKTDSASSDKIEKINHKERRDLNEAAPVVLVLTFRLRA